MLQDGLQNLWLQQDYIVKLFIERNKKYKNEIQENFAKKNKDSELRHK